MKHLRRHDFVAGSAAALAGIAVVRGPARAAQFEFKCGSNLPVDSPVNVRLQQMWNAIEQESGGRLRVQNFPSSQLGTDSAMFSQLRLGALEFCLTYPAIVGTVIPAADIANLGFAFKDVDEALRVVGQGPLATYIHNEMEAKGVYLMGTQWTTGMYQVSSADRPLRVPADFHGFRIRTADSKITVDLWKELGANPVGINASEIYTALKTKLVDGSASGAIAIETFKFYEVQKYVALTNHAWSAYWLLASTDVWKKLPRDLQDLIEKQNAIYGVLNQRDTKTGTASTIAQLQKQGITFTQVDQAPFIDALRGYFKEWSGIFGATPWALLQNRLGRRLA